MATAPALRCRACATVRASTRSITPTAGAITSSRSTSIVWLKIMAPEPTSPTTAEEGTRQSSIMTCAMGLVRSPIFAIGGPTVRPGVSRATRKQVMPPNPWPVRA